MLSIERTLSSRCHSLALSNDHQLFCPRLCASFVSTQNSALHAFLPGNGHGWSRNWRDVFLEQVQGPPSFVCWGNRWVVAKESYGSVSDTEETLTKTLLMFWGCGSTKKTEFTRRNLGWFRSKLCGPTFCSHPPLSNFASLMGPVHSAVFVFWWQIKIMT